MKVLPHEWQHKGEPRAMGERDAIWMMIGKRDELTPQEAERMGVYWGREMQRNPRAEFMISIDAIGY
jgi:hypothetical protein